MKKLISSLFIFAAICSLTSCGSSKEERAQKMAANHLKGFIANYDSYEPIETEVDSTFASLLTDEKAIGLTEEFMELVQSGIKYAQEAGYAEHGMEIEIETECGGWFADTVPNGYRYSQKPISEIVSDTTVYVSRAFQVAKLNWEKCQKSLAVVQEKLRDQFDKMKQRQQDLDVETFNGWFVYHKFKYLNGQTNKNEFGECVYFCDKDFKIKSAYTLDEYEIIEMIINYISESSDITEVGDKMQNLML